MKNRIQTYLNILFNVKGINENLQDLKAILFTDKTTAESINLFLELKRDFEEELSKRKLEAILENNYVDSYFKPKPSLRFTTVKDVVFSEPIKN
jgi:hypothetical protein